MTVVLVVLGVAAVMIAVELRRPGRRWPKVAGWWTSTRSAPNVTCSAAVELDPPLVPGRFVRRYKRFFADVQLDDGREVTAHCTNTGSLRGCLVPGARVMIQPADSPGRKLRWTWKLVRIGRAWVGVDTMLATPLVIEAIERGRIPELSGYDRHLREVPYGAERRSRIDVLLSRGGRLSERAPRGRRALPEGDERAYVEVKNTTLAVDDDGHRIGAFPDAVSERGLKHLRELVDVARRGHRAVMVYCVQRADCHGFAPADAIDPAYGEALREALDAGVEAYALGARVGPKRVRLERRLPLVL